MRRGRWLLVGGALALTAACSGAADAPTSTTATTTSAAADSSKLRVTVPALGGVAAPAESAAVGSAAGGSTAGSETASSEAPETTSGADLPPTETAPVASAPTAPATVAVELVDCDDCAVIATRSNVAGDLSAALITSGGRATLLSVDAAGSVIGILNVPYGATFPAPGDGQLACGDDGRCVVVAAQPDGRAILSAFLLTETGAWQDLSGSGGFVSATTRGQPVMAAGSVGVAIQVSDGTTTVWTVLHWNGELFATVGCAPDAAAPDLTALSLASCLS